MKNAKKTGLVVALAGVLAGGAWMAIGGDDDPSLQNQAWLERVPKNGRDQIGHIAFVDHKRGRVGVTGRSSRWKHEIEVFFWAKRGEKVYTLHPQTNTKREAGVRVWDCEGDAPRPFQLCLELKTADGTHTFYSRRDWVIEPGEGEADDATVRSAVSDIIAEVTGEPAPSL